MNISIEIQNDKVPIESLSQIRIIILDKLQGEIRDTDAFHNIQFTLTLVKMNELLPNSVSKYYQKTKRLDIPVFIPFEYFSDKDEDGRYLLTVNNVPEDFEWPFYNTEIFNPIDKDAHERKKFRRYR